jgi:hypothetical protein
MHDILKLDDHLLLSDGRTPVRISLAGLDESTGSRVPGRPADAPRRRPPRRPSISKEEWWGQLLANLIEERPYTLGTETEVVLGVDETIRLVCDENEQGVKEFLIYTDSSYGGVGHVGIFKDGNSTSMGRKLNLNGDSYAGGPKGMRILGSYDVKDEKIYFKFRTLIDEAGR